MRSTLTSRRASASSPSRLVSGSLSVAHVACACADIPYKTELELDEEGTRISLTIVDTPGFGDQIDNEARHVDSPQPAHAPNPRESLSPH